MLSLLTDTLVHVRGWQRVDQAVSIYHDQASECQLGCAWTLNSFFFFKATLGNSLMSTIVT